MVIDNYNSDTADTWQKVNKFVYWSMLLQTHQKLIALHDYTNT